MRFAFDRLRTERVRLCFLLRGAYVGGGSRVVAVGEIALGEGVVVQDYAVLNAAENSYVRIGRNSRIGRNAVISAHGGVDIGEEVLIADRVFISDHNHAFEDVTRAVLAQGVTAAEPVAIGAGSWLGINVCIMPGVTLGKHCVVGANSVVTKSFPDHAVIVGQPAKQVRSLSSETADKPLK
ncbi:MAG: acyltransferase [Caulobacter sp.]|nr:acyltransferase [Caulobacter sp.]